MKMPSSVKKLYKLFSSSERVKLLVLVCLMLIAALLEVAGIGMIPAFVSVVSTPEKVMEYEAVKGVLEYLGIVESRQLLIWGAVSLIGIFLVKNIYLIGYAFIESRFINHRMYRIANLLMSSYMQAPYTFHLQRNTAELLRNVNQETKILVEKVIAPFLKFTKEVVMAISIIGFLLYIEPLITFFVFILLGSVIATFLISTQKRLKKYGTEEQQYRHDMIKAVNQGLGGIQDARVLNREADFIEKFRSAAFKRTRHMAFHRFITQIPKPVVETIAVGGMMLIALVMVWQGRPMSSIIPVLSLFAMAIVRLMPAMQMVISKFTMLRYNLVAVDPIYDDIQELSDFREKITKERERANTLSLNKELSLEGISYSYPNSQECAVRDINLTIPRGSAIGFTGPSGAGKTTLMNILLGLLEPQKGKIEIDGVNIDQDISAWQRNIGYIPQSIYLSDESLRNNIAFGLPDEEIDDEKVWKAIELAQLKDHVMQMPYKLDTILGEDGVFLSGGQRQRVGIARALYHDPQVLVMDEATSALDNITEKYIMDAIEALKGDRTILIIAHRLTTVKNCDQLFYMENGEILQKGTYEELVEKNKNFREMTLTD